MSLTIIVQCISNTYYYRKGYVIAIPHISEKNVRSAPPLSSFKLLSVTSNY